MSIAFAGVVVDGQKVAVMPGSGQQPFSFFAGNDLFPPFSLIFQGSVAVQFLPDDGIPVRISQDRCITL